MKIGSEIKRSFNQSYSFSGKPDFALQLLLTVTQQLPARLRPQLLTAISAERCAADPNRLSTTSRSRACDPN